MIPSGISTSLHPNGIATSVVPSTVTRQLFITLYDVFPASTSMCFKVSQPLNAELEMLVTLEGISTDAILPQPEKALSPIVFTPSEIVTDSSNLHPENAPSPIHSTLAGIVTVLMSEPQNAASLIQVTPAGICKSMTSFSPTNNLCASTNGLAHIQTPGPSADPDCSQHSNSIPHHAEMSETWTSISPSHPLNASISILVTLGGIVTDFNPEQPENVNWLIFFTPNGNVTDTNLLHPENAEFPISVTLDGIVNDVNLWQ